MTFLIKSTIFLNWNTMKYATIFVSLFWQLYLLIYWKPWYKREAEPLSNPESEPWERCGESPVVTHSGGTAPGFLPGRNTNQDVCVPGRRSPIHANGHQPYALQELVGKYRKVTCAANIGWLNESMEHPEALWIVGNRFRAVRVWRGWAWAAVGQKAARSLPCSSLEGLQPEISPSAWPRSRAVCALTLHTLFRGVPQTSRLFIIQAQMLEGPPI